MTHHTEDQADDASHAPDNPEAMRGFDPEFTDIIDYILRITYRIWEGKQVDLCRAYYSADCPVYTLAGLTVGAEEVTRNTADTQRAFPDRTLRADAIICGGNARDGFHTSHLIYSTMTNMGDSDFGPASGKHAAIQVIAHCIVKENRVIEEWLVRDNYSLAEQLGFDPLAIARQKALAPPQPRFTRWRDAEIKRLTSGVNSEEQALNPSLQNDAEAFVRSFLHNIWNAGQTNLVHKAYAADAILHGSANRELHGHAAISSFYTHFLATFSAIRLAVDYVCQQAFRVHKGDTKEGLHMAARWTLTGQHTGTDLYGTPSEAPVLILGESHYHIVDGLILEEWTVFDELAIWTQIYRAQAGQASIHT